MVLAQDQDNSRSFGQTVRSQNETHSPTWEEMLKVFQAAGLSPSHCFFTNFIPGIRWLATRNTAPSPALAHPAMMRACAAFFIEQFQVQQPKLIITLGKLTFTLLGLVSSDWRYRTAGITEFKDLDDRDMLINHNVAFDDAPGSSVTVVPLYHPCDIRNGAKRNFSGKHGIHNEVELLAQALTCLSAPRE
jgi:uracil-DNA glycosylase